ncbi:hypothetical protein G3N95_09775 [Paraburkholderia sp. Tr-20389]|uniref:hypothetical protein n=1 Tax=Paraburkholderia sp. Tr-20389 TaxID=2703903 RepID=UPI00197D6602|nr:hypothetical protein [Paraburkholderia sp. Tr-20389]MBN3753233.1 hypothetical protein [Paraburkholderia sp. Tr-20389]
MSTSKRRQSNATATDSDAFAVARGDHSSGEEIDVVAGEHTRRRVNSRDVLAVMTQGIRYSTQEIADKLGQSVQALNPVLTQLANDGRIWQMPGVRSSVFWIPTKKEAKELAERRNNRITWNKGTLQGYDEQHRTFQALCMLSRRS